MITVISLVRFEIKNFPKGGVIGPVIRPNQTVFIDALPEHLGKPLTDHLECLHRGNIRKPTKANITRHIFIIFPAKP